ncbi:MAG: hypothetical protein IJ071_11505 [Ruminococcus sp.]|nr:hypothetical protein [Ruminococcus sp.]
MFTKKNTLQAKGAAAILMICHHVLFFKDRIPTENDMSSGIKISDWDLTDIVGAFGKLCVALFMFLGGYGLFCSWSQAKDKGSSEGFLSKKIVRLYLNYWKVFLIMVPIAFIFFGSQEQIAADGFLSAAFCNFQIKPVISDFIMWTSSLNREWWFYRTYLFAMFEGMIFILAFRKRRNIYAEILTVLGYLVITKGLLPYIAGKEGMMLSGNVWYFNLLCLDDSAAVFFIGAIFAKYDVFKSWSGLFQRFTRPEKALIGLIGILAVGYIRTFVLPVYTEAITAPVFLMALILLTEAVKPLGAGLGLVGRFSTGIWLCHTFFCYYFVPTAKVIYCYNSAFAAVMMTLLMSLPAAVLIELFWKYTGKGAKKLRRKLIDFFTKEAPAEEGAPAEAADPQ